MTATAAAGLRPWPEQVIGKLTGRGRYPSDQQPSGCRYAALVRSTRPHARVSVDLTRVEGVLVAADRTMLGLEDRVRQVGDVVAGVVAETQLAADRAAAAIAVHYAELPHVDDPAQAADSPVRIDPRVENNVVREVVRSHGDVAAALAGSAVRHQAEYRTGRAVHFNLARRCCYVEVGPDGRIHLLTSADAPYFTRHELAAALDVADEEVVVTVAELATSSFGGRTSINPLFEPVAARLARLCPGLPIRLMFSPAEELTVSHSRHPVHFRLDAGCDAAGRLTGLRIEAVVDHGPYPSFVTDVVLANCRDRPLDLLALDNYHYAGTAVLTNNPTAGEMRGIGVTQVMWVVGVHLDELARRAGHDSAEFLLRNAADAAGSQAGVVGSARRSLTACFERLGAQPHSSQQHVETPACRHGRGVAAGTHTSGLSTFHGGDASTARIRVGATGRVELAVAAPDSGQGSAAAYRAIAASVLALPANDVTVSAVSTASSPYDRWGSVASRGVYVVGPAVAAAARELRERVLDLAAARLGVPAGELRLSDGLVQCADGRELGLAELADLAAEPLEATGDHATETNPPTYGMCAVEVCVDADTGIVQVLHAVSAFDVGHAIDHAQCRGQLVGAFAMGWEFALGSELGLTAGVPSSCDPYDFRFAHAADLPKVDALLVELPEPANEFGARGIGTPAITAAAPAICNAVRDAVGVRLTRLPGTAEDILRGMAGADA